MTTATAAPPRENVLYEKKGAIAYVTINRPKVLNALNKATIAELNEAFKDARDDAAVRGVILTGAGDKAFASGTDISQFRAFKTAQDALDYEARIDRVLGALETCRVPTIAAIAGACTGGGAGIAACCDLRIGTASTRIGVSPS